MPAEEVDHCQHIDEKSWEGLWIPPIEATHLTPQKARILLMLALGRMRDDLEIRQIFERY